MDRYCSFLQYQYLLGDSSVDLFNLGKSTSTSRSKKLIIKIYKYKDGVFLIKTGDPSQVTQSNIKIVYLSNRISALETKVASGAGSIQLYYQFVGDYVYIYIDDTIYNYAETTVSLLTNSDWIGDKNVKITDTPDVDLSQMSTITI